MDVNRAKYLAKVRDRYICQQCGYGSKGFGNPYDGYAQSHRIHAHHIVPIRDGGTNDLSNIITLCSRCHGMEHSRLYWEKRDAVLSRLAPPRQFLGDADLSP